MTNARFGLDPQELAPAHLHMSVTSYEELSMLLELEGMTPVAQDLAIRSWLARHEASPMLIDSLRDHALLRQSSRSSTPT